MLSLPPYLPAASSEGTAVWHVVFDRARTRAAAAVTLLVSALAAVAPGQSVFRAGTQTVPVYATVTDRTGALVTDLTAADFKVLDDGVQRPLTVFESDVQPITVVILVDRSPSLFAAATRPEDLAAAFVGHLHATDRASLGTFSQVVSLNPVFTSDADSLVRRFGDDVPWPAGTAMWDAIDAGRAALAHEGGRRVILIVTDAADNCSRSDVDTIRSRLQRDGIMVYAVGMRGREGLDLEALEALARATGGWAFELGDSADLPATAERIADELHRQYVLGFPARSLDDRTHRIEVQVRRPGLSVRARRSYFASSRTDVR
jgi:Ca-activated chloride channel homolog